MSTMKMLTFPHKMIRSKVIKAYMQEAGYDRAVCFTCGNAGRELQEAGVDVLIIGAGGKLLPNYWFSMAEVQSTFKGYFDATSGHLNIELMKRIGKAYKRYLGNLESPQHIPSGSGECLVCLKLAYPGVDFIAEYDVQGLEEPTRYDEQSPLNALVRLLAKEVNHGNGIEYESDTL